MSMRRPVLVLAIAAAAFCACSPRIEAPPSGAMPEGNDANCRPEAIESLPKRMRQAFASACFRAGTFKPSPPRYW